MAVAVVVAIAIAVAVTVAVMGLGKLYWLYRIRRRVAEIEDLARALDGADLGDGEWVDGQLEDGQLEDAADVDQRET